MEKIKESRMKVSNGSKRYHNIPSDIFPYFTFRFVFARIELNLRKFFIEVFQNKCI